MEWRGVRTADRRARRVLVHARAAERAAAVVEGRLMAQEMPFVEQLAAVATLGTRRAPLPKELAWPHASLAPLGANAAAPETTLLRAAIAGALWDAAGGRSAPAVAS